MKIVLSLFVFCLYFFSQTGGAAEPTKVVDRLNELLTTLETFKANFTQNITTETGEQLDQLSGEIAIKKPGRFYWKVTQPFEQLLIADGKNLWQYDRDLEQATVRSLDESLGGTPAEILMGTVSSLGEQFKITSVAAPSTAGAATEASTSLEKFLLLPKEEGQFEAIELSFLSEALSQITLKDTLGQTTKVEFSQTKFALALPQSLFIIDLPDDVELVDSRTNN